MKFITFAISTAVFISCVDIIVAILKCRGKGKFSFKKIFYAIDYLSLSFLLMCLGWVVSVEIDKALYLVVTYHITELFAVFTVGLCFIYLISLTIRFVVWQIRYSENMTR